MPPPSVPPDAGAPVEVIVIDEDDSSEAVMNRTKKQRIDTEKRKSRYIKVGWIPCSTREVERLFFMCERVRNALFPESMDVPMYPKD